MYFPYLRGKQFEALAVRDAQFLPGSSVVPLIEPTNLSRDTLNRFSTAAERGTRFALIVNSANGKPAPEMAATVAAVDDLETQFPGAVLPAFEIRAGQPTSDVGAFAKRFKARRTVVIHRNHSHSLPDLKAKLAPFAQPPIQVLLDGGAPLPVFMGVPAAGKVLLRDGFRRQARNADYPAHSNFDDLLYTHRGLGFDGFGDFATVGDRYSPTGGAALHVALHLTEAVDGTTIIANHFVSTTPPHKGDVQGKYFSALSRAIKHTGSPPNAPFDTEGVSGYSASHRNRQFSGLGKPIQWSTMHHMELIDRELRRAGSKPFI